MAVEKTDKEALAYFQVNGVFLVIIRVALTNRSSELIEHIDHLLIDVKANLLTNSKGFFPLQYSTSTQVPGTPRPPSF